MELLVLICAAEIARADCTPETARASRHMRVEGVVCGVPTQMGFDSAVAPVTDTEYWVVKCKPQRP